MQVNVSGFNKRQTVDLRRAAELFANLLMDPRIVRSLVIDIEHSPKSDVQGECIDEDDFRNPRWFTIHLRGIEKDDDIIKTLAHEMVHVKQYAKNELHSGIMVPAKGGLKMHSKWMGKVWKAKRKEDSYYDSPWEIEAYGREVGLYARWIERNS